MHSTFLKLPNPAATFDELVGFVKGVYQKQNCTQAVVAVSGGIDSALSLTLATQALGPENVMAVSLPYADQSTATAQLMAEFNHLPASQHLTLNIKRMAEVFFREIDEIAKFGRLSRSGGSQPQLDALRKGNIMARCRMIVLYDLAKQHQALVCGTENKSEKYLGYFTRFGDEASDLEPLQHLYKTQVWELATFLKFPERILTQAPSAGLWEGQTDEAELGFSYRDADKILVEYIDRHQHLEDIVLDDVSLATVAAVIKRVEQTRFKLEVPFTLPSQL